MSRTNNHRRTGGQMKEQATGQGAVVFVYGTLRQGQPNHYHLRGQTFLGTARTQALYHLVSLGPYPAMVEEGSTVVVGELYQVDRRGLAGLDRLEGHPDFYRRQTIELEDGTLAQTYLLPVKQAQGRSPIPSGDWLDVAPRRLW